MARYIPSYPGRRPAEDFEEKQIPADCKCTWSHHDRDGQSIWSLKYINVLCAEHRDVKQAEPSLVR